MAQEGATDGSKSAESPAQRLPAIAAAFLVRFDHRKGYVLDWQQSADGVQVEGAVEFKSLPSGLHHVQEDLIYFIHNDFAGISAFLQQPDVESARGARMLAVGLLLPLESGRMGKAWQHAESLQELVRNQIEHIEDYDALEKYWLEHKISSSTEPSPPQTADDSNTSGYQKLRSLSTSTLNIPPHTLTPHHPVLALPQLLWLFGPLVFPLFRATLLRKRILILGEAPVELTCDFVYNLSLLSSLTKSFGPFVPIDNPADLRCMPLFNVGVTDIPQLASIEPGQGWIACTTDDVLCSKPDLFDVLVILPALDAQNFGRAQSVFPRLVPSSPELTKSLPRSSLRATQRDARRFQNLKKGLRSFTKSAQPANETTSSDGAELGEDSVSISSSVSSVPEKKAVVEPISWTLMAYTSIIWWASAGDSRTGLHQDDEGEAEQDVALLFSDADQSETQEVALITYFHRLTNLIFSTLGRRLQESHKEDRYRDDEHTERDDNEQTGSSEDRPSQALLFQARNGQEEEDVEISEEDMKVMGLDIWSASDRVFVEEMVGFWWGEKAIVRGGSVECCGIKVL